MNESPQILTVVIPLPVKQRGGWQAMLKPGVLELKRRQDIALIKTGTRPFW